jgi:predicted GTPase
MKRTNILIMGAAGRDFHNFNVCFRHNPACRVKAFTAAQIPFIADRRYPPSLAGPLYPSGIPIFPEEQLEQLILKYRVDKVIFSYSDISYADLMHTASRVIALGASFELLGPDVTMLRSRRPVIAVCAVRTGCGKSGISRYICDILREHGIQPVVVRHPMPYGDLRRQEVLRFVGLDDLTLHGCTIEEREEFEPLLQHRAIVYAGVDYARILQAAEREGQVLVWDGGNNDFPFFRPDLEITLVDPLRPGHETAFYPGEVNLRRAAVVVINKANAVSSDVVEKMRREIARSNPSAIVITTASVISVSEPMEVRGKRVLVVEDGPSLTHGSLATGAGFAAAKTFGACQVVDPRPYAVGSIADTLNSYPHIGPVLPAMGYRDEQIAELRRTIDAVPCDLVLAATPIDLERLLQPDKPMQRVSYDIVEREDRPLRDIILRFLASSPNCVVTL